MREKHDDAARPKQEHVTARKVLAHAPAENARRQDQESSAPGSQNGARLIVPQHQAGWAVELLHPHRGDEENGDKDSRCKRVRKFAPELIGNLVIDRLSERGAPKDKRQVDAQRNRSDRPIGDWQSPPASLRKKRSGARSREPTRRFRRGLTLSRH